MPRFMTYKTTVYAAGPDGAKGAALVTINGDYSKKVGLNKAVSDGLAFTRRFQSAGVDAEFEVSGQPGGEAVVGAARDLQGDELLPQIYVTGDTPGRGLLQKIALANSVPAAAAELDADEDVDNPQPDA